MELYQVILVPIAFGLLGFVEPCSIGANIIFLGYLESRGSSKTLETVKFMIARALFLGLIGLAVGIVGQSLRSGAYSYSLVLGVLYMVLGFVGMFGAIGEEHWDPSISAAIFPKTAQCRWE